MTLYQRILETLVLLIGAPFIWAGWTLRFTAGMALRTATQIVEVWAEPGSRP